MVIQTAAGAVSAEKVPLTEMLDDLSSFLRAGTAPLDQAGRFSTIIATAMSGVTVAIAPQISHCKDFDR